MRTGSRVFTAAANGLLFFCAVASCAVPEDVCNAESCNGETHYCLHSQNDIPQGEDGYKCLPLPDACASDRSCDCVLSNQGEWCGDTCEVSPDGHLRVVCQGD